MSTPVQLVHLVQLGRIEQSSKKGLDHILSHFQGCGASHWPRTVSTKATQGRQVIVTGKKEALAHFKAA